MERYSERVYEMSLVAADPPARDGEGCGPPTKRVEILHRCGSWVRKDMIYCSACGHMLHRKDGSLV